MSLAPLALDPKRFNSKPQTEALVTGDIRFLGFGGEVAGEICFDVDAAGFRMSRVRGLGFRVSGERFKASGPGDAVQDASWIFGPIIINPKHYKPHRPYNP